MFYWTQHVELRKTLVVVIVHLVYAYILSKEIKGAKKNLSFVVLTSHVELKEKS